jgi:hypothetical protein
MALGIGRLDSTGIDEHRQLADFAAGREGGHHVEGEGHPRQASAVATRQTFPEFRPLALQELDQVRGETAGAAGLPCSPRRP